MTPKKIMDAYRGVSEFTAIVLPFKEARALARLKRALEENMDVIEEAERALVRAHGGKPGNKPYSFSFDSAEAAKRFNEAIRDFQGQDDETLTLPTVDLSGQTAQLRVSADAIAALEGIILFEREESVPDSDTGRKEADDGR